MDSTPRLIAKALSWQMLGLGLMTVVGYVFTGSLTAGGGIALAGAALGLVSYVAHEAAWQRVAWGRKRG